MKIFTYLYKFARLKFSDKRLIMEAVIFLFISRMFIILMPYKVLKLLIGTHKKQSSSSDSQIRTIRKVARIIAVVSDKLPWKCNCLPQAITGRIMLKIRKIDSTIYLGMSKDNEKKIIAHAWLKVGAIPVTGGRDNSQFVEVAYFG